MQRGVKINSLRLKEARLFRQMTILELAEKVNINKQAISQFENSKTFPDPMTLNKIANILRFPYSFFTETDNLTLVGNTYFRALYSSKKKDLAAQKIKAKFLGEIYYILSQKVKFKELNLPAFDNRATIEEIAKYTRDYWGLSDHPISNMVNILEQNGIIVGEFRTDSREIDAFYQYSEENGNPIYCVVLGTDKGNYYRRQFNCAHELGHILLHERYSDLDEINRDEFREREKEANAFAAAFLMPEKSFGDDVAACPNKLTHYIELKKKWNVSISAMIMRAHSLGIISLNQYTYLMRQISANGYRMKEPLDDLIEYKHPRALKQSIELLINKANMSLADVLNLFASNHFSISANIIEELLNYKEGELSGIQVETEIIQFSRNFTI